MQKYSNELKELILNERKLSNREIAEKYNIPYNTIKYIRNGIRNEPSIEDKYTEDEFNAIFYSCNTIQEIADRIGFTRNQVRQYMKTHGLSKDRRVNLQKEDIDYILSNYNNYSAKILGKKFGVSSSYIAKVWMDNDLKGKIGRVYTLFNEDVFSKLSKSSAYMLGFICSDGCLYHHKDSREDIIRICIQKCDEHILNEFKTILGTNKPLHYTTNRGKCYANLEISSNKLVEDIYNLGISTRKTWGNTIPNISNEFMPAFIRGYVDGDGSIPDKIGGNLTISGYKKNMFKLLNYLESINVFGNFVEDRRVYGGEDTFGSLLVANNLQSYCICKMLYDNDEIHLNRKYERAKNIIDFVESRNEIRYKQAVVYYKYAVYPYIKL